MEIILVFVAFFVKHFLADYPLQTPYMLKKTNLWSWKLPLTAHCAVHSVFTYLILTAASMLGVFNITFVTIVCLTLLEFCLHWLIDAWKAQRCRYKPNETAFWVALGADQLFHYLTYALLIALII